MKSSNTSLTKRPDFKKMNDNDIWLYIQKYMDTRCTVDSALIRKIPQPHREDVRQDALMDLWAMRNQYNPTRAGYSTFAYIRIRRVVNLFLKKCKRDQRAMFNKGNPPSLRTLPDPSIELELVKGVYNRSFSQLDQEVITRRNAKLQSFKTISSAMDCSIGVVKDILKRSEEFIILHI